MDLTFPLAKTGVISEATNLWLAIPIGIIFGYALFHAGFTDSRRIAWAFYFKDVGVPVVMFSAIVTGMLGLWGLSLVGVIDISQVYMLPTFLLPMAVGGVLFGIGMAIGGYCPGTAAAAVAVFTVMRTTSLPARARVTIWSAVWAASSVSVFVIDCTITGWQEPTAAPAANPTIVRAKVRVAFSVARILLQRNPDRAPITSATVVIVSELAISSSGV